MEAPIMAADACPTRLTMRKRPFHRTATRCLSSGEILMIPSASTAFSDWFENVLVRNGQDQEAWERNQKCKQDGPIIEKRQLELGAANDKRVRAQPGADQKRKQGERDRNGIEPEKRKRASPTAAIQAAEESVCGRAGGRI